MQSYNENYLEIHKLNLYLLQYFTQAHTIIYIYPIITIKQYENEILPYKTIEFDRYYDN